MYRLEEFFENAIVKLVLWVMVIVSIVFMVYTISVQNKRIEYLSKALEENQSNSLATIDMKQVDAEIDKRVGALIDDASKKITDDVKAASKEEITAQMEANKEDIYISVYKQVTDDLAVNATDKDEKEDEKKDEKEDEEKKENSKSTSTAEKPKTTTKKQTTTVKPSKPATTSQPTQQPATNAPANNPANEDEVTFQKK